MPKEKLHCLKQSPNRGQYCEYMSLCCNVCESLFGADPRARGLVGVGIIPFLSEVRLLLWAHLTAQSVINREYCQGFGWLLFQKSEWLFSLEQWLQFRCLEHRYRRVRLPL